MAAVFCLAGVLQNQALQKPAHDPNGNNWPTVALVDGMGFPLMHAVNVLHHHGIDAFGAGSRAYGVHVDKSDLKEACAVLAEDAKKHPYDYIYVLGFEGNVGLPKLDACPLRKFDVDFSKIDTAPEFRVDDNLRGLAREAVLQQNSVLGNPKGVIFYIKEMRVCAMEYMDRSGSLQQGYKATVTIGYRGQSGTYNAYEYAWDHGRQHVCRGGGGEDPFPVPSVLRRKH